MVEMYSTVHLPQMVFTQSPSVSNNPKGGIHTEHTEHSEHTEHTYRVILSLYPILWHKTNIFSVFCNTTRIFPNGSSFAEKQNCLSSEENHLSPQH